ncbi:hypothetical protein [Kitasatospora fiedleri]|uniref:hypothetical protein n=1 Tax=Kitasatospora fiedleri TaxID=2991545 RepID=UPI00249A40A6|nr:hypothetical protein [Kitasatospora fiedleri]
MQRLDGPLDLLRALSGRPGLLDLSVLQSARLVLDLALSLDDAVLRLDDPRRPFDASRVRGRGLLLQALVGDALLEQPLLGLVERQLGLGPLAFGGGAALGVAAVSASCASWTRRTASRWDSPASASRLFRSSRSCAAW